MTRGNNLSVLFMALCSFSFSMIGLFLSYSWYPVRQLPVTITSSQSEILFDTCENIINGRENALRIFRNTKQSIIPVQNVYFYKAALDEESICSDFKNKYQFLFKFSSVTNEELNFPIAFSIAIYKNIDHFARLLRIIYRPQNLYIVHVDLKSPKTFVDAVHSIVQCFERSNIIVLPKKYRVKVKWACFTNLLCHYNSLKYLFENNVQAFNVTHYIDWKYYINLSGQEFPLRTNLELVKILKSLQNRSQIQLGLSKRYKRRFPTEVYLPFHVNWKKGSVYIAAARSFCEFSIYDEKSKQILIALKKHSRKHCRNPDEVFFQTLYYNHQLGTTAGCRLPNQMPKLPDFTYYRRGYVVWMKSNKTCHSSKAVRGVCIFGVDDLRYIIKDKSRMFVNKFHENFEPVAYDCIEQWLLERAKKQIKGKEYRDSLFVDLKPYQKTFCQD